MSDQVLASLEADPLDYARELLGRVGAGQMLTPGGVERDCAVLIASAQIAHAYHLRRVANSIDSLIVAINNDGLFTELAGATMDAIADDMRASAVIKGGAGSSISSGNPGTPAAGG